MAVWYSLWSFGMYLTIWNVWTKKNLATLSQKAIIINYLILKYFLGIAYI
jgi:hypothetical protein